MWTNAILENTTVMFMLIALIPMVLSNAFVNMDTKKKERAAKVWGVVLCNTNAIFVHGRVLRVLDF